MNKLFILVCTALACVAGVVHAQMEEQDPFNAFVPFKAGKNSWGFQKNRQTVIPAQYEYVTSFSQGYALVKSGGKWGYIDTLGAWYIEPQYDKGQPFQNGLAFVKKNGKTGLIDIDKRVVIEPLYDNIREDYSAYYLINDGKMGYLDKDNLEIPAIPALYDSITYTSEIVSGKNADGSWDIYFRGVRVIEKSDEYVNYRNHHYFSGLITTSVNGRYGIYSLQKGWLIQPAYGWIEGLEFPDYNVENWMSNTIFAMHDHNLNEISPEERMDGGIIDSITLLKADGQKISPLKFNDITSLYDRYAEVQPGYALSLNRDGKLYHLMPDFTMRSFNFGSVVPHYYAKYFFTEGNGMSYILDRNYNVIDSFFRIEKYRELARQEGYGYYDPETGEYIEPIGTNPELDFIEVEVEEPFAIVYKQNNGQVQKAVYQLEDRKIISPWFPENEAITVSRNFLNEHVLYTYHSELDFSNPDANANKKMGYYVKGMKTGTDLLYHYDYLIPASGPFFAFKTKEGEQFKYHLFRRTDKGTELVSSEYEIIHSAEVYGVSPEFIYDPETESEISYVSSTFTNNFLILKQNKKFGLICYDGTIIQPQYDSLMQNTSADFVINTLLNEKIGTVDLYTGDEIKPRFDTEPYINTGMFIGNRTLNYIFTDDMYGSMMDLKGKEFHAMPESTFPRKIKKNYALYGYSAMQINKAVEQVGPKFRYIEPYFIQGYFLAQGKNKKWGIIDFIGDTVIPISYDKIEAFNYNGDSNFMFEVTKKKKKGLYDLNLGEIIPCKYDEILPMGDYEAMFDVFKVKTNNKFGLVRVNGEEWLPAVYDDITLYYDQWGTYFLGIKGNKRVTVPAYDTQKPETLREYDFVSDGKGYVRSGEKFEVFTLADNKLEKIIGTNDLVLTGNAFNIIVENGKFGAANREGQVLVPCEYDFATFMEYRDEVMIGYQNGIKYYIYVDNNERYTEDQW